MRALLILALLLLPITAKADENLELGRKLFTQAAVEYRLGDFRAAVGHYQEALKLTNRPSILFNLGQCYRQLGELERALFYYRLYLSQLAKGLASPGLPSEPEVRGHIAKLTAELEQRQREARAREEARTRRQLELQRAVLVAAHDRDRDRQSGGIVARPLYKRWWLWTLVGGALVGTASAILAVTLTGRDSRLPEGPVQRWSEFELRSR